MSFDPITMALCGGGGGGLTVIEMDEPVTEDRPMTAGEQAKFEAATEIGLPVIVKFNNNGLSFALICHCVKMNGMVMFEAVFNDGDTSGIYVFGMQEGTWVVSMLMSE